MTEAEWLAAADPETLFDYLQWEFVEGRVGERKLRLVAVACCRLIWHSIVDMKSRAAVEAAEEYSDGKQTEEKLRLARHAARSVVPSRIRIVELELLPCSVQTEYAAAWAAISASSNDGIGELPGHVNDTIRHVTSAVSTQTFEQKDSVILAQLAQCFQDIFGNPFRPVAVEAEWLTSTVVALAEGIYQERAFDRMPVLADALEDVGCDQPDILSHCQGDGPHVRGCWVVDLLLGKH